MDNALIDDRRIHVDFSQSVSKLWSQYRRKGSQSSKGKVGCVCICLCNKQLMLRKILVASVLTLGNSQATWFDFPYRLHQFIWNQPLSKARKTQCILSLSLSPSVTHTGTCAYSCEKKEWRKRKIFTSDDVPGCTCLKCWNSASEKLSLNL